MISKKAIISAGIIIFALVCWGYLSDGDKIPDGWFKAGSDPNSYNIGIENKGGNHGGNTIFIKSNQEKINGFGTLMQNFSAEKYLNKRVRFSGYVKSKSVAGSAGLWMRIDGKENPTKPLGFDNMNNRPIKGTSDWKKYNVVLDIPPNSNLINIGVLLAGTGEIWTSDLKFETVDKSVPTTDLLSKAKKIEGPVNLDLKK
ncbi:MAG: hypothetical protein WCE54_11715 [Ignavibacteriaceae bacterium]